jgi:uncharacterized protein (TIGR02145 family)
MIKKSIWSLGIVLGILVFGNCQHRNDQERQGDIATISNINSRDSIKTNAVKPDSIYDIQGNSYKVISFRNQWWTASNSIQSVFNNGDVIEEAKNPKEWLRANQNSKPVWCYLNYDSANSASYGIYYNWWAINDPRGIFPQGWSIPTYQKWHIMARELNFEANFIKEAGWWKSKRFVYNQIGFSARPNGMVDNLGRFLEVGNEAFFWTATSKNTHNAYCLNVSDEFNSLFFTDAQKRCGFNIRYFKSI